MNKTNVPIVATGKFVYGGAATHDANFANKGENVCHPKNCHRWAAAPAEIWPITCGEF